MQNPEQKEKNQELAKGFEPEALRAPDAQTARNAGASDLHAVEAIRTHQSDGSLRKFAGLADQEMSIELCYEDKVASRTQKVSEKELLTKAPKEPLDAQSKTIEALEVAAKSDPVADVMLLFRRQADAMPPGPEKERLTRLAREQAAQHLASNEQDDCGVHERPARTEPALKGKISYPEQELEGVKRLTPEDLKMLAKAFEAGPEAARQSIQETSDEILRRTGEASRDTLLAGIKAVVAILEYDRDLMINPEEARKKAASAGEAFGVLLVAGVQISAGGVGTIEQVRQTGDYSLPLKNISEGINRWYDRQSPADQMAIAAEVCTGFGMTAGAVEVNKLRKPGAFMQFVKEGIDSVPRNPEAEKRAMESIAKFFKSAEPLADTGAVTAVKAGDVVKDAQDMGLGDHVLAMVKYFEEGKKRSLAAEKAAGKVGVTTKELHLMTPEQLAAHGLERIEKAYDLLFYSKYPHLRKFRSEMQVHHALPQDLLEEHPGLFKAGEINDVRFLSGIPNDARINGKRVHQLVTDSWGKFLKRNTIPTREQVLNHMRMLDEQYGRYFVPPVGEGER